MAIRNRPRVDVTLRVSGFFRDAFPNVIDLFDTAVRAVAAISEEDEPDDVNPIRARVQREAAEAQAKGLSAEAAQREATWRVFGPRPGGYGAGLQEVMASGRWNDGADLAQAYLRAGAFAYGQGEHGARRVAALSSAWRAWMRCCTTRTTASTMCSIRTTTTSSRAAWRWR
jgi:cobaltochelatase CobN